jgi:phenylpropionate dioxygenase-like ring-hydroxylating dioxygenase large terminal subunit
MLPSPTALNSAAQTFENEWFAVALAEEINGKKPYGLTFYGQEIAIWRNQHGALCAIDARCPHMGASLARGRIVDDAVECPYHGFRYDHTGACVETPLRKPDALIPRTLCTRRYAVTEKSGWIFLFWGEAEDATDNIPFFDDVKEPLLHETSVREWPVSFTRFIENTVDVAHLGTVHRGTLSHTIPKIIDVECTVDGNFISVIPPSTTDLPIVSKIGYPNLALLHLHPKFLTVFVAVPVDEEHSRIYVRSSQAVVRWPLIGWLFSKIKHWADMAALWQDKKALFSVRPIRIEDAGREVLMEFEPQIVAYRKMRKQRLADISQQTPASPARQLV